jgi:antitoxin component YwqK of YwqJK toxin-antitoxin module
MKVMYKVIFLLIFILFLNSCIPTTTGSRYRLPIGVQFNKTTQLFELGNFISSTVKLKNKMGTWLYFNKTEHFLIKEENYKDDVLHGQYREFNKAGKITYEVDYIDGKKNGWESTLKKDDAYTRCKIDDDILHGSCYKKLDGKDYLVVNYVNGKREGKIICYWPDSRIKMKGQYRDGIQIGKWVINPRDKSNLDGYKIYYYDDKGKRTKIVYPKLNKVDNNPNQLKLKH